MTIHIPASALDLKTKKLYLEGKLRNLSIDYHPNSIMGWNGDEQVTVFSFDKICKLDNRFTSYNLYQNKTEIIIEIVGYKN